MAYTAVQVSCCAGNLGGKVALWCPCPLMCCVPHQHFHVLYKTVQRLLLKAKAQ